jgi:amino acid adenylation domain-containing protein
MVLGLVQRHLARTARSRAYYQANSHLADWKSSLHYRATLGTVAYPIVAAKTEGGRFTDVDGNDYLDVALGMGVHLLGHNPFYVTKALFRRLKIGYGLGPQCDITGEVAAKIARLTGLERVSFCNTGSEAVMFSLRLARAKTDRPKVVIFSGSYHGTFDGVLGEDSDGQTLTYSPGTPAGMVEDLVVLPYGSEESLRVIEDISINIAAVLVEPVQSRKPALQPQSFLKRLRKITRERGIALIFDEMVNGFRLAPGGASQFFGIKPDMALYGKIIGGGLPIGVVAGGAVWLDGIDGGRDEIGGPSPEVIVYGGTFCRHPLSMEAALATCDYLLAQGPNLHAQANLLANTLADRLNWWFQSEKVPLRLRNCGTQFVFEGFGPWSALVNPIELDLFYLSLLERGVFVWERRTCFFSTCHVPSDMAFLEKAVKDSVLAIRAGGFAFGPDVEYGAPTTLRLPNAIQERFHAIFQRQNAQRAYHLNLAFSLSGQVDAELLEIALIRLVERHEALRTSFIDIDGQLLVKVWSAAPFELIQAKVNSDSDEALARAAEPLAEDYDTRKPPLFRAALFERPNDYILWLDFSHLILDGASLGILVAELNAFLNDPLHQPPLPRLTPLAKVEATVAASVSGVNGSRAQDLAYWTEKLQGLAPLDLPLARPSLSGSNLGSQRWLEIKAENLSLWKAAAKKLGVTLNMFLNGVYALTLRRYTGQNRFCVALAHSGRFTDDSQDAVGLFVTTVPQDFRVEDHWTLAEFYQSVCLATLDALEKPTARYEELANNLGFSPAATMLSYEKGEERVLSYPGVTVKPFKIPTAGTIYDYCLDIVELDHSLKINVMSSEAMDPEQAESLSKTYVDFAQKIALNPTGLVGEVLASPEWLASFAPRLVAHQESRTLDVWPTFQETSRRWPEKVALVYGERAVSYSTLFSNALQYAQILTQLGLARRTLAYLGPTDLFGVTLSLACLKAAVTFRALNPRELNQANSSLPRSSTPLPQVLVAAQKPDWLPPTVRWLEPGFFDNPASMDNSVSLKASGHDSAAAFLDVPVALVSGSFSPSASSQASSLAFGPAVALGLKGLSLATRWFLDKFNPGPQDRVLALAPLSSVDAFLELWPSLLVGAEIYLGQGLEVASAASASSVVLGDAKQVRQAGASLSPEVVARFIHRRQLTIAHLPTRLATALTGTSVPSLRFLFTRGDLFHYRFPQGQFDHYHLYGPPELTGLSHCRKVTPGDRLFSLGFPVVGAQNLALDPEGRLCPPGRTGELAIAGPLLAMSLTSDSAGALDGAKLVANPLVPSLTTTVLETTSLDPFIYGRLFTTGREVKIWPNGEVCLVEENRFVQAGRWASLAELEAALLNAGAREAKGAWVGPQGQTLWAYVAPANLVASELSRSLAANGMTRLIPQGITVLDNLPLDDYGQLVDGLINQAPQSRVSQEWRNLAERILAQLWKEKLKLTRVSRDDNFFSLGGNSIQVIRLVSNLRKAGHMIAPSDFYQFPVLADLAQRLILAESAQRGWSEFAEPNPVEPSRQPSNPPRLAVSEETRLTPQGNTVLGNLPLDASGQRADGLINQAPQSRDSQDSPDLAERVLAQLWMEELKLTRVSRDDNFFSLGGNSKQVVQIVSNLRKAGYLSSPTGFYDFPILADLAQRLILVESAQLGWSELADSLVSSVHLVQAQGDQASPVWEFGSSSVGTDKEAGEAETHFSCPPSLAQTPLLGPLTLDQPNLVVSAPDDPSVAPEPDDDLLKSLAGTEDIFQATPELSLATRANILAFYGDNLKATWPVVGLQKAILSQRGLYEAKYEADHTCLTLRDLDWESIKTKLRAQLSRVDSFRFCLFGQPEAVQIELRDPPPLSETLVEFDGSGLSPEEYAAQLERILEETARKVNQLERGPFFQVALLKNPSGQSELWFSANHVMFDGWSVGLMVEDAFDARPLNLSTSYVDYLKFIGALDSGALASKAYWAQLVGSLVEATEFKDAKIGSRSGVFVSHFQPAPQQFMEKVQKAAQNLGIPISVFLEAAWAATAARATKASEVVYGVVDSGRSIGMVGVENVIGPLLMTIPRRLSMVGLTFAELTFKLSEQMIASMPHVLTPLAEIIKLSTLGPDLVASAFNFRPPLAWPEGFAPLSVIEKTQPAGFELGVCWEWAGSGGDWRLELVYDSGSMSPFWIASLGEAYLSVIEAAARCPETLVEDLPLCSEAMARRLLENNAPAVDYEDLTVVDLFLRATEANPEGLALINSQESMTYGELASTSEIMARGLIVAGVKPGDLVGLSLDRSPRYPLALLSVLRAQAAFTPLDPQANLDRLLYQLDLAKAKILLIDGDLFSSGRSKMSPDSLQTTLETLKNQRPDLKILSLTDLATLASSVDSALPPNPEPDSLAYAMFTSGSTGRPKGALIDHRAIYNHCVAMGERLKFGQGDRQGAYAVWTFDVSLFELLTPLTHGAAVYIFNEEERLDFFTIHQIAGDHKLTHLFFPPDVGRIYLSSYSLAGLKFLDMGGGVFPEPFEVLERGDCVLVNGYGPTECAVTTVCAVAQPGEWPRDIGWPIDNCPAYVVDKRGRLVPEGFSGELCLGGVQVGRGYLGQSSDAFGVDPYALDAPAAYRAGRWYRTGDLARRLADGRLTFLGRLDRQIKFRGRRMEVEEVEGVLRQAPGVENCAVVKWSKDGVEKLLAYLTWQKGYSGDLAETRRLVAQKLPAWMAPDLFLELESLPTNAAGKVDFGALPDPFQISTSSAPVTEEEEALLSVVAELLKVNPSLDDDFLAIGGDSVKAVRVTALLSRKGFVLQSRDLYGLASLRVLAASMTRSKKTAPKLPAPEKTDLDSSGEVNAAPTIAAIPAKEPLTAVASAFDPTLTATEKAGILGLYPGQVVAIHSLTAPQQSMLIARDGQAYRVSEQYRIKGPLDPVRLRDNWLTVTQRHEVLRAAIVTSFGRPWQVVLRERQAPFSYQDLSQWEPARQQAALAGKVWEPDLARDPLFGVDVFRVGPDEHVINFYWHHVMVDGWSLATIFGELLGAPSQPRPHFREYVAYLATLDPAKSEAFWRESLAGVTAASSCLSPLIGQGPVDPPPLVNPLGQQLTNALKALGAQRRLTLNSLLQTALALTLEFHNGLASQAFLGLDSGRQLGPGWSEVVGLCVTPIPTRLDVDPRKSFLELAGEIQAFNFKAAESAHYPLAEIRAVSGLDLGDVLFVLENQPQAPLQDLTIQFESLGGRTELGLVFQWVDSPEGLILRLHYDGQRWPQELVAGLMERYGRLLAQAIAQPGRPVGQFDFLGSEKATILATSQGKTTDYASVLGQPATEHSVPSLFQAVVSQTPQAPALLSSDGRTLFTFAALAELTDQLALRLVEVASLGALKSEVASFSPELSSSLPASSLSSSSLSSLGLNFVVGLHLPRGAAYVAAALSVLKAGGAFLPLDPDLPLDRLELMVRQSQARVIIGATDHGSFNGTPKLILDLAAPDFNVASLLGDREPNLTSDTPSMAAPIADPDRPVYVIYTSGSTGQPKGVVIPNQGLVNLCLWKRAYFDLKPGSRTSLYAPVAFDASVFEIFPTLLAGGALVELDELTRTDPPKLAAFFRDLAIDHAFLPPAVGQLVLKEELPAMSLVLAGDKPGSLDLAPRVKVYNAYGPTEFTVCSSAYLLTEPDSSAPIGRPVDNTASLVLGEDLRLKPAGHIGQIALAGVQVTRGYVGADAKGVLIDNPYARDFDSVNDPGSNDQGSSDQIARSKFGRLYLTGDLGYYDFSGQLRFLGRLDDQIKVRGQRLEPGEVESLLTRAPGVAGAVVGLSTLGLSPSLTAWIAPTRWPILEVAAFEKSLRASLVELLPVWMWPANYVFLESFPLDRHGKVDRRSLPAPTRGRAIEEGVEEAIDEKDGDPLLSSVRETWAQVLGFTPGVNDNFLEQGGDSIKAMLIVGQLKTRDLSLDQRQFFLAATPRAQTEFLRNAPRAMEAANAGPSLAAALDGSNAPNFRSDAWGYLYPQVQARFGERVEDFYPLTPTQQGLLFETRLETSAPAYIEQNLLLVEGFEGDWSTAIQKLAQRHPVLRTVFWDCPTGAFQVVLRDLAIGITIREEVSSRPPDLAAEREILRATDLSKGPLIRFLVVKGEKDEKGENKYWLAATFHHLIVDGWSLGIALLDLFGQPQPTRPFGQHVRELLTKRDEERVATEEFWRASLTGYTPKPWPFAVKANTGTRTFLTTPLLAEGREGDFIALARAQRVSVATALQTIWGLLVAKLRGAEEALFGLALSGRGLFPESLGTLGLLVNIVPRRLILPREESFLTALARVGREGQELEARALLSLPEALALGGFQGPAKDVLDHLVVVQNLPAIKSDSNARFRLVDGFSHPGPDLCVVFNLSENAEGLGAFAAELKFCPEVFEPAVMEELARLFSYLVDQILADPTKPLSRYSLLTPTELAEVKLLGLGPESLPPVPWPFDPDAVWPKSFDQRTALVWTGGRMTYAELGEKAERLKRALKNQGLGAGQLVALELTGPNLVVGLVAILRAGAAYLPLEPSWPVARRLQIVSDSGAALLLAPPDSDLAEALSGEGLLSQDLSTNNSATPVSAESVAPAATSAPAIWFFQDGQLIGSPALVKPGAKVPVETAYVIYTSGSTGRPKGVAVGRDAFNELCQEITKTYGFCSTDRSILVYGQAFDGFIWGIFPILALGAQAHFPPEEGRRDVLVLRDYMLENGITVANIPTIMAEAFEFLEAPPTLRLMATGGDALKNATPQAYLLYNEYGPTEASMFVTRTVVTTRQPIPIGRARAGAQVLILDPFGDPFPRGMAGEIALSGTCLAIGYLGLTAGFGINPHPGREGAAYQRLYRTGDLGRFAADGELEFLGRLDQQVSLCGYRVEPAEIEARIKEVEGVLDALAIGGRDDVGDQFLWAYFIKSPEFDQQSMIKSVQERLALTLPRPMWPKYVISLDSWPRNANGKISLQDLPKRQVAPVAAGGGGDLLDNLVLEIMGEVLGRAVAPGEGFFAQGGNSLKATRLVAKLEATLKLAPTIAELMADPTPAQLADILKNRVTSSVLTAIRPGSGTALILVPAAGGSLWAYRQLWRQLPPGRPIYALEPILTVASSAIEQATPERSLAAWMGLYAQAVADLRRPVILVGLCLAGLSAWELASQLLELGVETRAVVTFNTRTLAPSERPKVGQELDTQTVLNLFGDQSLYEDRERAPLEPARERYGRAQLRAWGFYEPKPLPVRLWSFRPENSEPPSQPASDSPASEGQSPSSPPAHLAAGLTLDESLGLEDLAQYGRRTLWIPGGHFEMLNGPGTPLVVGLLDDLLGSQVASQVDSSALSSKDASVSQPRPVNLTPIQRWYFSLGSGAENFFQSVFLSSPVHRPSWVYETLIQELIIRHDGLRARFRRLDGGLVQCVEPERVVQEIWPEGQFVHQNLGQISENGLIEALDRLTEGFQLGVSPALMSVFGVDGDWDRLGLRFHHLVIDGVSWRLLALEVEAILKLFEERQPASRLRAELMLAQTRPSPSSFASFSQFLTEWTRTEARSRKPFWDELLAQVPPPMPPMKEAGSNVNLENEPHWRRFEWSSEETSAFLQSLNGAPPRESLLAALLEVAARLHGTSQVLTLMEGHGRSELARDSAAPDYSSVVGWLTCLFPLPLVATGDWRKNLSLARAALAKVPDGGLSYWALTYGNEGDPGWPTTRRPDFSFNYHGSVELGPSRLTIDRLGSPLDLPTRPPNPASVMVDAWLERDKLNISFTRARDFAVDLQAWALELKRALGL